MKFLKSDVVAVLTWVAVSSTSLFLYYMDVTASSSKGGGEVVGTIIFKKKVAQRKFSSEVIWEDLEQNTPLYNSDTIRTEEDSEATINLKDGTKIAINENSMILLQFSNSALDIKFSHGSIKANRDEVKDKNIKEVTISSTNATISMNKSDINLSQEIGKELNLTVNKGNAILKKGDKEEVIKENQKVVATKNEIKIYPLTLIKYSPSPQSYFLSKTGKKGVTFTWKPVDKRNKLYLEISKNNSFTKKMVNKNIEGKTTTTIQLTAGIYYWRLRGKNYKNNKFEFSGTSRFSIIADKPVILIAPINNSKFYYNTKVPLINFKWFGENALNYKIIIGKDPKFKKIIFTRILSIKSISTNKLPDGKYFWRIIKTMELSGKKHTTLSPIFSIIISKTKTIAPPKLISPENGKGISKVFFEKQPILFIWENAPEINKSKILISTNQKFSSLVYTSESVNNFISVNSKKTKLPIGKYYWKIIGTVSENNKNMSSIIRTFQILRSEKLVLLKPENNKTIKSDLKFVVYDRQITFSWKKIDMEGSFKIEISKNNKFNKIYKTAKVKGFFHRLKGFAPGIFYWRVKLLNKDNKEVIKSNIFKFTIMSNLIQPLSFIPKNGQVIDMSKQNTLNFSWKKINDANLYEFELFQVKNRTFHSIIKTKTDKTNYTLTDLSKLDIGKFCYVLQSQKTSGKNGKIIRKSPKNRVYFSITLPKEKEMIKLKTPKTIYIEQ